MKHLALVLPLLLPVVLVAPQPQALTQEAQLPTFDHRMLDGLLKRHVKGDRVDYAGLLKDRAMLDAYCDRLEAVTPAAYAELGADERFALWANAYNAFTLQLIVDNYYVDTPGKEQARLGSILDLAEGETSAWQRAFILMGGLADASSKDGLARAGKGDRNDDAADGSKQGSGDHQGDAAPPITLDHIENGLLRPIFKDARVHAAVNCASISCPPLRAEAFTGANLDAQLDDQMRAFLSDTTRNRFDAKAKTIELSKIFEWYRPDFEDPSAGKHLVDFLIRYAPASLGEDREWIREAKISYLEYDWRLNDLER